MRGGASHGVIVRPKMHTECGKCVQIGIQYVQCVQAGSSQPGASRGGSLAIPEPRKLCKTKFQIMNVEGGRFSLRRNPKEKVGIEKEGGGNSKQVQNFNLKEMGQPLVVLNSFLKNVSSILSNWRISKS